MMDNLAMLHYEDHDAVNSLVRDLIAQGYDVEVHGGEVIALPQRKVSKHETH